MKGSKSNVKFSYLYRDAGNYKIFGNVVFHNREKIEIEKIEREIKNLLIDGEFFEPARCQIPLLSFEKINNEIDHNWNELEKVEITSETATDRRNISEFINQLKYLTTRNLHKPVKGNAQTQRLPCRSRPLLKKLSSEFPEQNFDS